MSLGLALLLAVLAAVLLFRLAPGQGVWTQPAARPRQKLAIVAALLVTSAVLLAVPFGVMVSATMLLCLLMLALCALPYLALLRGVQG